MFNIKYMGKYTSDEQLIKRKEIPENAVEFGIITDLKKELGRGFLMLLPLFLIMVMATIFKVKNVDYHIQKDYRIIISIIMVIASVRVLTLVHEFIHCLFYPRKALKTIWHSKEQGAYFVYCEEEVSKLRFIIMCLAPMFILGIIPFIIWLILPNVISMPYNIAVAIITWIMTIIAMGDVSNIYWIIKEVPSGAKVFNYGLLRSFYLKDK
ncbi:MAG: DUF3267 domain-containing protein [Clostridia bacterium]|nr:DUF3267 domain-containing protein [Clostridia bacterium]